MRFYGKCINIAIKMFCSVNNTHVVIIHVPWDSVSISVDFVFFCIFFFWFGSLYFCWHGWKNTHMGLFGKWKHAILDECSLFSMHTQFFIAQKMFGCSDVRKFNEVPPFSIHWMHSTLVQWIQDFTNIQRLVCTFMKSNIQIQSILCAHYSVRLLHSLTQSVSFFFLAILIIRFIEMNHLRMQTFCFSVYLPWKKILATLLFSWTTAFE